MKQLSGCILSLLVTLVCCVVPPGAAGQGVEIDKIVGRFSGYHLLTLRERDSETRAFILQHFPHTNPSIVHADFDGDGHPDYAILLKHNKSAATKLVVLLCRENAECKSVFDQDVATADSCSGEVYIRPVPSGSRVSQTDAIDTNDYPPPVRLGSTGIEVTCFGKAKVIHYWNRKHKKMEAIQTED